MSWRAASSRPCSSISSSTITASLAKTRRRVPMTLFDFITDGGFRGLARLLDPRHGQTDLSDLTGAPSQPFSADTFASAWSATGSRRRPDTAVAASPISGGCRRSPPGSRSRASPARVEDESAGVRVDLAFSRAGQRTAVEIEMGDGHAVENIRKDLAAGFGRVVCLLEGSGGHAARGREADLRRWRAAAPCPDRLAPGVPGAPRAFSRNSLRSPTTPEPKRRTKSAAPTTGQADGPASESGGRLRALLRVGDAANPGGGRVPGLEPRDA